MTPRKNLKLSFLAIGCMNLLMFACFRFGSARSVWDIMHDKVVVFVGEPRHGKGQPVWAHPRRNPQSPPQMFPHLHDQCWGACPFVLIETLVAYAASGIVFIYAKSGVTPCQPE